MALLKRLTASVLLVMIVAISHDQYPPEVAEATPLSSLKRVKTKKFFASLGLECKCCDGAKGECRSSWKSSCSKLQCLPWKSY